MKKLLSVVLSLALIFALTACGGEEESSSVDPRFVCAEGQGMSEYDCYDYFDRSSVPLKLVVQYYCGEGLPYDETAALEEDEYGAVYAPVVSSLYSTLASLDDLLSMFYTGSFYDGVRSKARMDEWVPRYKEIDGVLYEEISGDYAALDYEFDMTTFGISENTASRIVFTVSGTDADGVSAAEHTFTLSVDNGNWRVSDWSVTVDNSLSSSASE